MLLLLLVKAKFCLQMPLPNLQSNLSISVKLDVAQHALTAIINQGKQWICYVA